jgi:signal transduction histidine kinase
LTAIGVEREFVNFQNSVQLSCGLSLEAPMRWPLRYQILLPMTGVTLATVCLVGGVSAYFAALQTERQIEQRLRDVAGALSQSSFPLSSPVLRQMHSLAGADFVLTDASGNILSSSRDPATVVLPFDKSPVERWEDLKLTDSLTLGRERFFYSKIRLRNRQSFNRGSLLHILYPERSFRQAARDAAFPTLVVGAVSLTVMGLVSVALASRIDRPLSRLQAHVERIAQGQFDPMPQPRGDDEVSDLARSVNRMAEMLASYDREVRRTERLRTLGQLGGGIAHQLRNSTTGCRMAIELHRRNCANSADQESLDVAGRQLALMEKYLQRFLTLGSREAMRRDRVDLCDAIRQVLSLVRPSAVHAGIDLQWSAPGSPIYICGDGERLQQLIVNLLLNAVEAASTPGNPPPRPSAPRVAIRLIPSPGDLVVLRVEDSGVGPDAEMAARIFEPFATNKPSGVGLGLCVAREIAREHGGELSWGRQEGMTFFCVRLPRAEMERTG